MEKRHSEKEYNSNKYKVLIFKRKRRKYKTNKKRAQSAKK